MDSPRTSGVCPQRHRAPVHRAEIDPSRRGGRGRGHDRVERRHLSRHDRARPATESHAGGKRPAPDRHAGRRGTRRRRTAVEPDLRRRGIAGHRDRRLGRLRPRLGPFHGMAAVDPRREHRRHRHGDVGHRPVAVRLGCLRSPPMDPFGLAQRLRSAPGVRAGHFPHLRRHDRWPFDLEAARRPGAPRPEAMGPCRDLGRRSTRHRDPTPSAHVDRDSLGVCMASRASMTSRHQSTQARSVPSPAFRTRCRIASASPPTSEKSRAWISR